MRPRLLLITDQADLARMQNQTLGQQGYQLDMVSHALFSRHIRFADLQDYDLILLNMYECDAGEAELCRKLRGEFHGAILVLTFDYDERHLLHLYQCGADDCLVHPVSVYLYLAKVNAWIRRTFSTRRVMPAIEVQGFRLDLSRNELQTPDNRNLRLSALEARLMGLLMANSSRILHTDLIVERVWSDYGMQDGNRHLLKSLVHRLRRKIEDDPSNPDYIHTFRDQGYCFQAGDSPDDSQGRHGATRGTSRTTVEHAEASASLPHEQN